jgi:hypothetical protein
MSKALVSLIALIALSLSLSAPARADAIDGNWCYKDGRRMSIDGPRIVTPGGTSTIGEYDRHGFIYVVPEGDPHAGLRIIMLLLSENIIRMFIPHKGPGLKPATVEEWQRCDLTM